MARGHVSVSKVAHHLPCMVTVARCAKAALASSTVANSKKPKPFDLWVSLSLTMTGLEMGLCEPSACADRLREPVLATLHLSSPA